MVVELRVHLSEDGGGSGGEGGAAVLGERGAGELELAEGGRASESRGGVLEGEFEHLFAGETLVLGGLRQFLSIHGARWPLGQDGRNGAEKCEAAEGVRVQAKRGSTGA